MFTKIIYIFLFILKNSSIFLGWMCYGEENLENLGVGTGLAGLWSECGNDIR